ncbi:MAG: PIG-L family deacetylase [Caldilineaceae bacterium]|nr:PIG-L family deacetylase [Caldilineaceae bacterium]
MAEETPLPGPDWENVKRVLVIMAHPDDPDFTCAGTVIQMARQGIEVTYMILTNGDKGNHNPEITRNQLIAMRKIEQRAAAEMSGVKDVLFMGVEDGFLRSTRAIRKRVTREIRRIRPEIIICPHPDRYLVGNSYINHPDHRNAGLVALDSIFPAADNPMFYPDMADEGYLPHKISQLYVTGDPEPSIHIDISNEIDLKIQSILCHKSQISMPDEALEKWKERWGEKQEDGSLRFFERYRVLKFT